MDKVHSFYSIIVAGGNGSRMNSEWPKQFLSLNGKPILMHTIDAFYLNEYHPQIILVLAEKDLALWNELLQEHRFETPHQIVFGGTERFHSVKSALTKINDANGVVAVHDAVRPLVSQQTISNCFKKAAENGNAIAAIPSKDSVRRKMGDQSESIKRTEIYLVQTPQTFVIHQLEVAYQQEFDPVFTDDASVVEKAGFPVFIEKSDEFNFKITFKEDLLIAETLIKNKFRLIS